MTPTFHVCELKIQEIPEPKISIGMKRLKIVKDLHHPSYEYKQNNLSKMGISCVFALTVNWSNN